MRKTLSLKVKRNKDVKPVDKVAKNDTHKHPKKRF